MKVYRLLTIDIETGRTLHEDSYEYPDDAPVLRCDRSASKAAGQAATTAASTAGDFGKERGQIGSSLIPGLESQAANPTGFSPTDVNNMTVAAEQGAGGTNSAITGEAALHAGRTRNEAGFAGALDEAAREKGRTLSSEALGVQNENAQLKQQKQHQAQQELQGLYGTDTSGMLSSMGLETGDINAQVNAGKSGWLQNITGVIEALGKGAQGAGALVNR